MNNKIQTIINDLWHALLVESIAAEARYLSNINRDAGTNFTSIDDYFADVYAPAHNLEYAQHDQHKYDVWVSVVRAKEEEVLDILEDSFILGYHIVDIPLFRKRAQQYRQGMNVGLQLQGLLNQELDFDFLRQKLRTWATNHGIKTSDINMKRMTGHGPDYRTWVGHADFHFATEKDRRKYGDWEYVDLKTDAADFIVTSTVAKYNTTYESSEKLIDDLMDIYIQGGDVPTPEQMEELVVICAVSRALRHKQFPCFISLHQDCMKLNTCANIILKHRSTRTAPPGFFVDADLLWKVYGQNAVRQLQTIWNNPFSEMLGLSGEISRLKQPKRSPVIVRWKGDPERIIKSGADD